MCNVRAGYDFHKASSVEQLKHATDPMLFIHGAAHAKSAQVDPELYWNTVNKLPRRVFLGNKQRLGFVAKNALWSAVFDFSPHFRKAARERCARERLLLELRHKGAYIVQ